MLIQLGIVLVSIIPVMGFGGGFARAVSNWRWSIPIAQTFISVIVGLLAFNFVAGFTVPFLAIMAIYPFFFNILSVSYTALQKKRALDGSYGEETKWAAELVEEGDMEFAMAIDALSKVELREAGIIADSKEELRETVIDRLDELTEDTVPEDFMQ